MPRTVQLLLVENVDSLGIVGDVVNVKVGYARNFLLPRGLATEPSEELLQSLADRRAEAERERAALRKQREGMVGDMEGIEISLERSCNDQGILYGSVTQHDLAEALTNAGYAVRPREVRLAQTIKRIGSYDIHIKLDADLDCDVHLVVKPDRDLDLGEREDMEFDNEGNLVEKPAAKPERGPARPEPAGPSASPGA